jgi:hypothetical protein
LQPENIEYGGGLMSDVATPGFSAEDIVKMRAKRILLNDQVAAPATSREQGQERLDKTTVELLVAGITTPIRVTECPLLELYGRLKTEPKRFLEIARLVAIFVLKASGVVEHVIELSLGPIKDGKMHVWFRGKRRKQFVNQDGTVIEIEGDCPLA